MSDENLKEAIARIDDLAKAESKRVDERINTEREHNRELRQAEAKILEATKLADKVVIDAVIVRLANVERNQYTKEGTGTGMKDLWGYVIAFLMAVIAMGGLLIHYFK